MSKFKDIYASVSSNRRVKKAASPELEPLLKRIYDEIVCEDADISAVKRSLVDLLSFLASPSGRTDVNCVVTDLFFTLDDLWEKSWHCLPDSLSEILSDTSILHDTIRCPEIARNFGGTPEQILEKLRNLKTE